VGTEVGLLHRLRKESPDKRFFCASGAAVCPNMKRTNLEKILWAMEDMAGCVRVPKQTGKRALRAVERMLHVAAGLGHVSGTR
jgi:quinolinate synthase